MQRHGDRSPTIIHILFQCHLPVMSNSRIERDRELDTQSISDVYMNFVLMRFACKKNSPAPFAFSICWCQCIFVYVSRTCMCILILFPYTICIGLWYSHSYQPYSLCATHMHRCASASTMRPCIRTHAHPILWPYKHVCSLNHHRHACMRANGARAQM